MNLPGQSLWTIRHERPIDAHHDLPAQIMRMPSEADLPRGPVRDFVDPPLLPLQGSGPAAPPEDQRHGRKAGSARHCQHGDDPPDAPRDDGPAELGHRYACLRRRPGGSRTYAACTTRRTDRTHPSAPTPAAVAASPRWNCGDPTPSAENNLQARCHQPRRHSCPARISRPSWPQSASPFLRTRLSQDGNTGSNPVEGTGVAAGHGPDRRLRRSGP